MGIPEVFGTSYYLMCLTYHTTRTLMQYVGACTRQQATFYKPLFIETPLELSTGNTKDLVDKGLSIAQHGIRCCSKQKRENLYIENFWW